MTNYLIPAELRRFGISAGTAANWRSLGKGPTYLKAPSGRVLYREADVIEWIESGSGVA